MNEEKFLGKPMPGIESMVIRRKPIIPTFSIGVLLYGNNFALAQRCLNSLIALPNPSRIELRIGLNEVCPATKDLANHVFATENDKGRNVHVYDSSYNRGKYPMMRWMFQDPNGPNEAPYIQWFDDDSYVQTPTKEWLDGLESVMEHADMCGSVMHTQLIDNQPLWITMQPWYRGKPFGQMLKASPSPRRPAQAHVIPNEYYVPSFAVGGWWTIKSSVLRKLDWPPQNIIHRGGDYMLGEALRQNDYKLVNYTEGVAINADDTGENHKAKRRGMNPIPVGIDYEPPLTVLLHNATKEIEPKMLDYPGI